MNSGDAAQGVTGAMEACTQDELKRRDAILNRTYRDSMGRIPEPERIRLRTAQRAWIKRRDAACKPNLAADKGSLGGLDYLDCMIDQTINQTVRLAKAR